MATGSIMEITGMPGFLRWPTSGLTIPMATGYTPITAGHGCPIIHGDGRLSITADG